MSAPGPVRAAEDYRSNWQTPDELFDPLHVSFGFDIDAASDASNSLCLKSLTGPCIQDMDGICDCGLCYRWWGKVWCNPPYGRGIGNWINKFALEADRCNVIVALLPANTDTEWFQRVWERADEIWFLKGRVQFVGTTSSNPGGSMLAVYRPRTLPEGLAPREPVVRLWDWKK